MKTEQTKIEWADYTFNPWRGCTKVSEGCANCYAEALSHRNPALLGQWGRGKPRVLASDDMWKSPLKWNKAAGAARHEAEWGSDNQVAPSPRPRVFCASLADWLDDEVPLAWLERLLITIRDTPQLDWLLLTKRPQSWAMRLACVFGFTRHVTLQHWIQRWLDGLAPDHVWIGASVENQARANERIPWLIEIPAKVRFLSCEPLLGPVDLSALFYVQRADLARQPVWKPVNHGIHWIIAGGESGPGARPMHPDWARSLRDQCQAAGVPFLFKQWGVWLPQSQAQHATALSADRELKGHRFDDGTLMLRMAKETAGRVLDGLTHDEFPVNIHTGV